MLTTSEHWPPREARFPVVEGKTIRVKIERRGDASAKEFDAELIDISHGGVKLSAASCPAIREAVLLRLVLPEIDLDLQVDARVCWSRPGPGELWYLGCALQPSLPDRVLTDLAINGFLQRRRDPRRQVDLGAQMRCEGVPEAVDVRIVDFSSGGLRIRSPQEAEMGQRLLLQLEDGPDATDSFLAKAAWQLRREDGYELGCTFVNKEGPELFHGVLHDDDDATGGTARDPRRRSRGRLLALVLLLAVLLLAYALIL
jgi:c-di-GMP-binding flagellar brake protein YcgR